MENNRKRGRETLNTTNNRKKHHVMMMMMMNENDDFDQIRYKWDNTKDFMRIKECHHDDESGTSEGAGAETGVFDFPWIKENTDVNFKEEIDECLDGTFSIPTTSSYNYYDDREIDIDTITITTTPLISSDNTLFDQKKLLLELDIDLDFNLGLDLIDQFFTDNSSNTGTTESSRDDDQLKVNKIDDQQLKIEVNDDQKLVEPKDGS